MYHTHVVVVPAHGEHTEKVHPQAKGTDEQQLVSVHFRGIEAGMESVSTLDDFRKDGEPQTSVGWLQTR